MYRAWISDVSVSSGRGSRRLMILVSSAVPLSDAITLVHLGPAHCSSNLCQGGSSALARALATPLSQPSALPPFLFLFLPLFARRALNYGGNATKSSELIELLLESRRGVRLTKKEREKKRGPSSLRPSSSPFILAFVQPSLAGMISRRREFPGNNFECVRLGLSISRRRWARIRGSNRL